MRPRHGSYAHDLRTLSAWPALAVRATYARHGRCAHSSAHDLGTARAVCSRHGFWVCALCTQPSFVTVHCLQSLFGSLFMDTVHEHCSQVKKKKEYKIFKNFLVVDSIYKIFILHLL